jgi:hypothetical protein
MKWYKNQELYYQRSNNIDYWQIFIIQETGKKLKIFRYINIFSIFKYEQ